MNTTVRQGDKAVRKAPAEGVSSSVIAGDQARTVSPARDSVAIAEAVVERIAATAAGDVSGIYPAGNNARFATGVARVLGTKMSSGTEGIRARIRRNRDVSLEMRMAVDYGEHIPSLGQEVRFVVAKAIRGMTDLDVREIKVKITEVRVPGVRAPEVALPK
jgi:uncharacterized alkaline shock family protein YloU